MANLREDYAHRRDNPLYLYFVRENCRPRQVFILASVCVFFSVTCGVLKYKFASTPGTVLGYVAFRWFLGEFLWCWLAADHAFSTIKHARETGRWRDWCITPLKPPEIASAFILSTSRALGIAVMATSVVEVLIPFHPAWSSFAGSLGTQLCRVTLLAALWFGHGATIPWAVTRMTGAALERRIDSVNWAAALGGMLFRVGLADATAVLLAFVAYALMLFIVMVNASPVAFAFLILVLLGVFIWSDVRDKRKHTDFSYGFALRQAGVEEPGA